MAIKKKFHGGLKVLLLLLFIMLLSTHSICFATDYTDFEIPVEFFDSLISYINSNVSYCPSGATTSISATALKNYYDNNIKSNLKTQFENINADERNIIIFIRNALNYSSISSRKLYICFLYSNNSVNNIENMRTINTATSRVPSTYTSYQIAYKYQPPAFYQIIINTNNEIFYDYSASPGDTLLNWRYEQSNVNLDNNFLNNTPFFGVNQAPLNIINATLPINNTATNYFINGYYNINPITQEPDNPSGDTSGDVPTNPSGDNNGNGFIDYTNQLNTINDTISGDGQAIRDTISGEGQAIRDTISGETEKVISALTDVPSLSGETISSGDITSALGFEFETDRYSNFWFELTQGLKNALLTSKRSIDVTFQNNTYTISLDDNFAIIPLWLQLILTPFTSCFLSWKLVKWWKLIIDKISSGNVDSLLKDNSEERNF